MTDLQIDILRELTPHDVAASDKPKAVLPPTINKIRHSHHQVARLLAEGQRPGQVAAQTGYSNSRISILQSDPTFQELVASYKNEVQEIHRDLHEKMSVVAMDVLDEIHERLDDEDLPTPFLLETFSRLADRTGYGPKSTTTNLNIHVGMADRLAEARNRAAEIIDVTPKTTDA
jgi:molybdopterin converting factor small subunit